MRRNGVVRSRSLAAWIEETAGDARALARRALGGAVAIDWGSGPRTGFGATEFFVELYQDRPPESVAAEQSLGALELAIKLDVDAPDALARWLYAFGATPPSIDDLRAGRSGDRPLRFDDTIRLASEYELSIGNSWEFWQLREAGTPETPLHKIYLSPRSHAQDHAFSTVVELLCRARPPAFKVAKNRMRCTRPDSFVVYLHDEPAREVLAVELADLLAGLDGCPVPFTSQYNDEGTLSCAEDPPRHPAAPQQSWRSWCTAHLGRSLSMAIGSTGPPGPLGPVEFALLRLSLEGVDTGRWCRVEQPGGTKRS